MTPSGCGRFCGACQKTVVDFTTMTDGQILDIYKRAGNDTPCGHFLASQLDRPLTPPKPTGIWMHIARRAAAVVLMVQAAVVAVAQQKKPVKLVGKSALVHKPYTAAKPVHEICGRVVDDKTEQGIEGVTVSMNGTDLRAVTMAGGIFRIVLPDTFYMQQMALYVKHTAEDEYKEWYHYDNYQLSWADMLVGKEVLLPRYKVEVLPQHNVIDRPVPQTYTGIAPFRYTEPPKARKHWFKREKKN